jgi:hypothetical protein
MLRSLMMKGVSGAGAIVTSGVRTASLVERRGLAVGTAQTPAVDRAGRTAWVTSFQLGPSASEGVSGAGAIVTSGVRTASLVERRGLAIGTAQTPAVDRTGRARLVTPFQSGPS